jgi:tartrate dehydratase alpha subunit/fumarate hydratase class I-like protein
MNDPDSRDVAQFDETTLHDTIAKVTETLPDDVRRTVRRAADEAGATKGTLILLDILRHLRVADDEELSRKAREAVQKKQDD